MYNLPNYLNSDIILLLLNLAVILNVLRAPTIFLTLPPSQITINHLPHIYNIRHQFTCTSTNIIYLITCNKCKKQYVGHTTNQLNTRINHHRSNILNKKSIYISQHFNRPDHSISNLKVQPIDKGDTLQELLKLETFWIKTLRTRVPNGLNISPGTIQFT